MLKKTWEILWQYYSDEPSLANHAADNSALFKFKQKITAVTTTNGSKNVELMVSLKHLSNF